MKQSKEIKVLPNIRLEKTEYQKLLKIILKYSLKYNKKVSINQTIGNLIKEYEIGNIE